MRTSSLLDGLAAGTPSMKSKQSLERRDPPSCQRVWYSLASTSQVRTPKYTLHHDYFKDTLRHGLGKNGAMFIMTTRGSFKLEHA